MWSTYTDPGKASIKVTWIPDDAGGTETLLAPFNEDCDKISSSRSRRTCNKKAAKAYGTHPKVGKTWILGDGYYTFPKTINTVCRKATAAKKNETVAKKKNVDYVSVPGSVYAYGPSRASYMNWRIVCNDNKFKTKISKYGTTYVTLPGCSKCHAELWSTYTSYSSRSFTSNYIKWMVSPNKDSNNPDYTWKLNSKVKYKYTTVKNNEGRYGSKYVYFMDSKNGYDYTTPCIEAGPPGNLTGLMNTSYTAG